MRDKFVNFWGEVAKNFHDNENIVGYELVNEPWCGNIYEDPLLLIPGVADRHKLQPMYDQINDEIRKHDTDSLIWFQSVTWELLGLGEKIGFTHAPGGKEFADRSVLSFHKSIAPNAIKEPYYYDKKFKEMERLGVAGAVTETNTEQGHINFDLADQYGLSWMHWGYKKFSNWTWDDDGLFDRSCTSQNPYDCAIASTVKNYARTYPRAVAGDTVRFNYNDTTGDAMLEFAPNFDCELPTEIFLSETWVYKEGYEVEI